MTVPDELDVKALMELYGKRLDNEHTLIASRMGWLLTLDSFLLAILGVGLANIDKLGLGLLFGLTLGVCLIGALSNASCLFSNYWAGRAIDEASHRVSVELNSRFGSTNGDDTTAAAVGNPDRAGGRGSPSADAELWLSRLRLYGRDPRAEPERIGFWRPPSGILHPWFLIPLVFVLAFGVIPFSFAVHWDMGTTSKIAASCPSALLLIVFAGGGLADYLYKAQLEGLSPGKYWRLCRLQRREAQVAARTARERRGRAHREKLERDSGSLPLSTNEAPETI